MFGGPRARFLESSRIHRPAQHRQGIDSDYRRGIRRPHVKMRYAVLAPEYLNLPVPSAMQRGHRPAE